ncbi:MAG: gluconokinase, GntK/IdnK-type, partial [Trueperaceae bacterium]
MSEDAAPYVLVVMGVSGAGKTTVGKLVAERLGWEFADADDHHPAANVAKMAAGEPLTDLDREPWLERLHELVTEHLNASRPLVLACSALKNSYRRVITGEHTRVAFVYLSGSFELIQERLLGRHGHYMPTSLLQSQFDALEEPDDNALRLDVSAAPERLAEEIVERMQLARGAHTGTGNDEHSGHAPKGMEFTFRWWGPHDPVPMQHLAQVPNVRTVVTWLGDVAPGQVWSDEAIAQRQAECQEAGLRWTVVESVPVAESIKLASADRDEH